MNSFIRKLKKNWVDYFYNALLVVMAIFIIILLFDPLKVVLAHYFPTDVYLEKPPAHCYTPEILKDPPAPQLIKSSNKSELKDKLSIFSLIFALLVGVILKFVRDALEDIKKQSETAKLLEKHKLLEFDYLRISQSAKIISKLAYIAFAQRPDGAITADNWAKKVILEQIQVLYDCADSLADVMFNDKALQNQLRIIADDGGAVLDELRQDHKTNDFLEFLVELSQDKYPELAKSARDLHKALRNS